MMMMNKDERRTVQSLIEKLGLGKHFSVSVAWKTLHPKLHPMPTYEQEDWIKRTMRYAVSDGVAVESAGPRGGKGWTLLIAPK